MNKVLLIGSMPPPIGGVTIHIDRFVNLYNGEKYQVAVFDIKKRTLFKKEKYTKNIFTIFFYYITARIIHIHISNDYVKTFVAIFAKLFFKKVVYTHHNSIVKNKKVFKKMYKFCDKVILVNDKDIDKNLIDIKKTEVVPAFLPPYKFESLPVEIESELKKYNTIISTNCYLYNLFNKKHVYGFDLIVDAFYKLSKDGKIENTLLILVDPSGTTKEFVYDLLKGLHFGTNKVLQVTQKIDFVSLVKKSDITIRATRTDGDSLSIRESLYLNIPIIASDVTVRPEGTILFKDDDSDDLASKILHVKERKETFNYKYIDYGQQIINIYNGLL